MSEPFDIMSLLPADTTKYMLPAWLGCVSYAANEPQIMDAFIAETGNRWRPGSNKLERMIDSASGADVAFIRAFVLWVNVNLWGPLDGPKAS